MSGEIDEALEDADREHRYAQRALQRKRVEIPEGKVLRYEFTYDESEDCDKVWIDRLTGKEVLRYDAADPANTNSYYGARPDEESFARKGLDIYALIDATDAKPMPHFPVRDYGGYDDWDDDSCDHQDYEPDILTGEARCWACGHKWVQTKEEIERERETQVAYDKQCEEWEREMTAGQKS